jgi:hypothetical protein
MNTIDAIDPFTEFRSGSDIQAGNIPQLKDLQSALGNA